MSRQYNFEPWGRINLALRTGIKIDRLVPRRVYICSISYCTPPPPPSKPTLTLLQNLADIVYGIVLTRNIKQTPLASPLCNTPPTLLLETQKTPPTHACTQSPGNHVYPSLSAISPSSPSPSNPRCRSPLIRSSLIILHHHRATISTAQHPRKPIEQGSSPEGGK